MVIRGNLLLPDRVLYGGVLRIENGRIAEIGVEAVENGARFIAPGYVDIHNHGAMGHDYMEATDQALSAIAGHLTRHGVTSAQCTTVSAPVEQLQAFFSFFRDWQSRGAGAPRCRFTGIHIEGPYIAPSSRGAHPLDALLTPKDGYDWVLENRDVIHEITVAPDLPGMAQMIEDLSSAGILVAGGHDQAEPQDILDAVSHGMRHCTHIYCAMSTLHKTDGHRYTGLCEYAMTREGFTAEMIADDHHTPPLLAQMIYRCKGAAGLCLVSDAIAPAGLPESERLYSLGTGEDCTKVFVDNGVAMVEDKSCYAGSIQSLDQMVRNLVFHSEIPIADAVRMASLTPAEVIGIDGECGSIEVGKRADLCVLGQRLEVLETIVEGKSVYQR